MTRLLSRGTWLVLALVLVAGLGLTADRRAAMVDLAPAADLGQFNPGNIISDGVFFDGGAMSVQDVTRFIDLKGMNCRAGSDGTPCLKDLRQDTTPRAADTVCAGYVPAPAESAAVIITKVAVSCDINPRVLLVMMQKEQSLVTASGSSLYASRYQKTMGYACPDTAACDTAYFGFQNQVYSAARRFQQYAASPTSYGYRAGRTNTILYNPDRACGSSQVYVQNQATANLYIYTPYQPNSAALAAGYGSGDGCSAYGNRNFWLYYTDWFGSTQLPGQSAWQPLGSLDTVTPRTGDQIDVRGWAIDPDTTAPISVHVYVDGQNVGGYSANSTRTDVGALLPAWGSSHGYDLTLSVPQGVHTVCAFAINVGGPAPNPALGCSSVDTRGLPVGNIETAAVVDGQGVLGGWTLDPDTTAPLAVHAYVNGVGVGVYTAGDTRTDVAAIYPGKGAAHGFSVTVPLQPGANDVCLYAINAPPGGGFNPVLGCRRLTLQVDPVGNAEVLTGAASSFTVAGWAFDPETTAPIDVHVYVDGNGVAAATAALPRADVAAAFPGVGGAHGFSVTVPASPGVHQVCVYAINVKRGGVNPSIGCRSVDVGVLPVGRLDELIVSRFSTRVTGWAVDGDTSVPIDVHLYVDGKFLQVVSANGDRPDVGAVYPATGPAHGIDATITLPAGRHTVCAFAINVLGAQGNPLLSCLQADISGSGPPVGTLDEVATTSGVTSVSGWTFDGDAPATSLQVHYYLDGSFLGLGPADTPRTDVGAAYPGVGPAHGYTGYFVLAPGRHTLCTYAINLGAGAVNPLLGCRVVTLP